MQLQYYVALVIQFTAEIGGFEGRRHIIVFTTYRGTSTKLGSKLPCLVQPDASSGFQETDLDGRTTEKLGYKCDLHLA